MSNNFANYPSLKAKSVFITGGAGGIGASLVANFAAQGARVGFVDIDDKSANELRATIDVDVHYAHCNLLDIDALKQTIADFEACNDGHIDVLINNAGNDARHSVAEVDPAYWDDRMNQNLRHKFFAAQAVYKGMARAGGGSIINLGSTVVAMSAGNMPAYVTAKAAVYGMTRALARDFGQDRIRVNCIVPGWIMTERQKELWFSDTSAAEISKNQCLPDTLHPEDIACMALFLAADDSRHCTAQNFVVDGGWT
ncbi:MAG: SDR family oxidoreductase [Rhizobiales bacterium]|nr:SDR family oxidoreductase [Hyphomicrobiales bacterium]NRB15840.1 SDR family oxidoreductase [Hyphomicrobiales bacterium]